MRWLFRLVLLMVVLVVLALGGLWYYLDDATQTAIERGGEIALGVPTAVGGVRVQPLAGRIDLSRVRIANPTGFSNEPFFSLGAGRIEVDLSTLTRDIVVLPVIALSDVALRLERKGNSANYDALMAGAGRGKSAPDGGDSGGPGVVVRELTIDRVTAHIDGGIVLGSRRALTVEVPKIVLRDIGSETDGGVLTDQLTEIVIDAVLAALAKQGLGLPAGLVSDLKNLPLEVQGELVRQAGQLQQDAVRKADDAIDQAIGDKLGAGGAEAAKKGLKSLLGGGK